MPKDLLYCKKEINVMFVLVLILDNAISIVSQAFAICLREKMCGIDSAKRLVS